MREQSIFIAALQCEDTEARTQFLDEACGSDESLRLRVEFLLRANADAYLMLQEVPDTLCETLVIDIVEDREFDAKSEIPNDSWSPDQQIGPFRLIKVIGEGGMGTVWEAEQRKPVQRSVAIKVIKQGLGTTEIVSRFEVERHALAMMDHPNVARVIEAGTTDTGRPWIAMELVKGIPITQYCNEQQLTLDERIELMIPVCQAVQHAHQNGILHSDIKPSNILVTTCDGRRVPKVIDFGLARTIANPLADAAPVKEGGRIIGTLEYMSPEQADINGCVIDPRSDVYSLGIVLYELLTGTTPLTRKRTQNSAIMELLRLIREEEPQTPSTQVSASGDQITWISTLRRSGATGVASIIPLGLDWIVMRAVSKTREQRYESPHELALDLQRYLSGERVHACPGSRVPRFRAFSRRRATMANAVKITAMLMIVATAVRFFQCQISKVAERAAQVGEFLAKSDQEPTTYPTHDSEHLEDRVI